MNELEKLAIDYIIAREQHINARDNGMPGDVLFEFEMDMFKHLVNLANYVKFERPEFKEALGIKD